MLSVGVVPTPAVAYLIGRYGCDAGVMISASHNPCEYNGIKIFQSTGYKLDDAIEEEIEAIILTVQKKSRRSWAAMWAIGSIARRPWRIMCAMWWTPPMFALTG